MSDSKSETVDHWSFVEGVKSPLGRLADACLDAYKENGNPLLEEAANALRAIETVDLTGCVNIENPKPLPWHIDVTTGIPILVSKRSPVLRNGSSSPEVLLLDAIQRCMNTVHALQTKNGKPMSENSPIINDGPDADDISEVVIECVRNNCYGDMIAFNVAEITRDTNLWDDLRFDGLDMVELIMDVEDELSQLPPYHVVSIPEEVCDGIETVGDLVDAAFRVMGVRE